MDLFEKLGEIPGPMLERVAETTSAVETLANVMQQYNDTAVEYIAKTHGTITTPEIRTIPNNVVEFPVKETQVVSGELDEEQVRAHVNAITAEANQQNPLIEVLKDAA